MRVSRKTTLALLAAALVVGGPVAWHLAPASETGTGALTARVKSGEFRVVVTTTGELRAQKAVKIQGPSNAQQAQVYQMQISTLVPEGTVVKAGDLVATLDPAGVTAKVADIGLNLQKAEAQQTQAQLDSTLNLATAREEVRTLGFALEEKKLAKEQAVYEAPSIRRQAEIDYEKAKRAVAQAQANYKTKTQQAIAKLNEVSAEVGRQRAQLGLVQGVMQSFTIRAPSPGMVIYEKEWNGKKKTVGSQVTPWDPVVATLPDLAQMESVTYVNEIDVRKLAVGQPVQIAFDADPAKRLTGKVVSVANVGEQRPNADAKVFEVKIDVAQADTTLRPGMTTSNAILTAVVPGVLSIPLEAVSADGTVSTVYKQAGARVVRQQVETGVMNENEVVVRRGLAAGDEVLLSPPIDRAALPIERLPAQAAARPGIAAGAPIRR